MLIDATMGISKPLHDKSQRQKVIYSVIPFTLNIQNRPIQRDQKHITGCRSWGEGVYGDEKWYLSKYRMKNGIELDSVGGCTIV